MNGMPYTGIGSPLAHMAGAGGGNLAVMPTTMEELRLAMANGTLPGLTPMQPTQAPMMIPVPGQQVPQAQPVQMPQGQAITEQRMAEMIEAAFTKHMPSAMKGVQDDLNNVFKHALSAADYEAFLAYTQNGAPGLQEMMKSDKLYPLAQLLWETIKENVK